jgi:hypothetical protein
MPAPAADRSLSFRPQSEKERMIRRFLNLLTVVAGFSIIGASGAYHGWREGRWTGGDQALPRAAALVAATPAAFGPWKQVATLEVDAAQLARAGVVAHVARSYRHERTHEHVTLFFVCGPAKQIVVHTPDVCYAGASNVMIGNIGSFKAGADGFARARFKRTTNDSILDIAWAWSTGGTWSAPESPRLEFGRLPYLYKLYAIRETLGGRGTTAEPKELREFLEAATPVLADEVFAAGKSPRKS